jgi:hypothetical protein
MEECLSFVETSVCKDARVIIEFPVGSVIITLPEDLDVELVNSARHFIININKIGCYERPISVITRLVRFNWSEAGEHVKCGWWWMKKWKRVFIEIICGGVGLRLTASIARKIKRPDCIYRSAADLSASGNTGARMTYWKQVDTVAVGSTLDPPPLVSPNVDKCGPRREGRDKPKLATSNRNRRHFAATETIRSISTRMITSFKA